jgi:hypothetical protein
MLQNTYYSDKHLKKIESMLYKFIWRGTDKIKRTTIKMMFKGGSLKGPCVYNLDKILKMKQLIRSALGLHDVALLQCAKYIPGQPFMTTNSTDKFITKGVQAYNTMGNKTIHEIIPQTEEEQMNRNHKLYIGNYNMSTVTNLTRSNPIEKFNIVHAISRYLITPLANIPSVIDQLSLDDNDIITKIYNRLPNKIKQLSDDDILYLILSEDEIEANARQRKIPTSLNVFIAVCAIKSTDLLPDIQMNTTHLLPTET